MKLYTRTGDDGTTGLFGGGRLLKHSTRVSACGDVDELNALLGWCGATLDPPVRDRIQHIQDTLFAIGAELSTLPKNLHKSDLVLIDEAQVERLENWIDDASSQVPPLKSFILPGGGETGARLHVARAVCRRAERTIVGLSQQESVRPVILHFMNRVSDLLFAWARLTNHVQGHPEIPWTATKTS